MFNVEHCAYTATIGVNDPKDPNPTGLIKVAPHPTEKRFMIVSTMNKNGQPADRPFHVIAMCSAKAN